jgi:hypothetical protein
MSASAKCLQAMLALFNLLFLAFGILVCISGGYALNSDGEQTNQAKNISITILAVGATSVVIGVFGVCGAFCRSRALLITYAAMVILLILAQCVVGGLSFAGSQDQSRMTNYSAQIWTNMSNDMRNKFQADKNCCGFSNALDQAGTQCPAAGAKIPCAPEFTSFVTNAFEFAGIYMFVAVGCEIVAVIMAFILAFDDRKRLTGYGQAWS